tara:strand:- start:3227 stop:3520 length:294 start_codon:yes stop_codon:yes gene_type:complete
MVKMTVKRSNKDGKKYMATFTYDDGKKKTTHFGQEGADDYTITKNKEQRKRYRSRHRKDLKTKDPTRAGHLSYWLLWGPSTSLRDNIRSYKKRFNFK